MRIRTTRLVALATAASALFVGAPAKADIPGIVHSGRIINWDLTLEALDLVTGRTVVSHSVLTPANAPTYVGDPVPVEAYDVAASLGLPALDDLTEGAKPKKCTPGGWDLSAYIDGKNAFNETVLRFHTDTEFFYDCKKVTEIPFVQTYGSDFHWFWRYEEHIAREKHGEGTKSGTVIGIGAFAQCVNYGFGESCLQHAAIKITWHLYANGSYSAEGA